MLRFPLRRRRPPRFISFVVICTCAAGLAVQSAAALWPFPPKRFSGNALIGAGSMGIADGERVLAFGDFNGDQFLDVMTLASDQQTLSVYLWNHDDFSFHRSASFHHPRPVYNVVPGDFTHDGTLDVLVMGRDASSSQLSLSLYASKAGGGINMDPIPVPASTLSQPIPLDIDGDMKIDLLGVQPGDPPVLKIWQNVWNSSTGSGPLYTLIDPPLHGGRQCRIANPHSNAVVDLDGDCLADIFLVCDAPSGQKSFQIWVNNKDAGFSLAQSGTLPQGTQSVAFADMDRDGTIDLLITTCSSVSPSTGLGSGCALNIAYNKQIPLCAPSSTAFIFGGGSGNSTDVQKACRRPDNLCSADRAFKFEFSGSSYVSHPFESLLPWNTGTSTLTPSPLIFDMTFTPPLPVLPRLGDVNLDGFPDLLLITGAAQDRTRKVRLLLSEPCGGASVAGCRASGARRGWREVRKGVEALESVGDARGAAFLDMDEDGTLDIMVQRTGDQGQGNVLFVQNNFYYDAFFMKATVLNGACNAGLCTPENHSLPQYHPFGVSYSGASYKYTILDTSGRRAAAQVPQLPQTAYQALHPPYAFFGLGRTNNYIENLFAGSTQHTTPHFLSLEMVIPNSQLVINPAAPGAGAWRKELYLRPGQWIPWVGVTVVGAMIGLAGVVLVLHLNEKREDELERRRASHHINFDAL
ncbi:integrin alpha N-terminal domain-containing protein [Auriscalpium vulgare]|uniref:Integrin alpha N-terminal domain-containing protein n=1 Tax=Auriscalpium vulgare TaxID=40419 RepID=A0ACB8RN84_9AGAM|nr:integrin alpha N-terminal domain-containing protein [Auriscalpium vulgare]